MKLIENGRDPPEVFYARPELPDWHQFYWEAFNDLSSERQIGMGIGPIPRSAILSYASEQELYGDAAEQFLAIIRAVDSEYLHIANSTKETDRGTTAAIDDVEGQKEVFSRMRARAAGATKPQVKSKADGQS